MLEIPHVIKAIVMTIKYFSSENLCCSYSTVKLQLKMLVKITLLLIVVSKHPRFSHFSNEVSSGIRRSASCVHAVNEDAIEAPQDTGHLIPELS